MKKYNIPFSPPRIDQKIIEEVNRALLSGWITTGPRTRQFEEMLSEYTACRDVLCVNSATAGLELMLRWFGVGPGDEVIVPAYTYAATANVVVHCGAKPVFADIRDDFNIDPDCVRSAITEKTKVIIPVDLAGWPCDYDAMKSIVKDQDIRKIFSASSENQELLGRIMVLTDAAHSLGAVYNGARTGIHADATVFSFHAVKNLTTGEGGAICINLPETFDNTQIKNYLKIKSLHGQTKDAFSKSQLGAWRYDIIEPGYKFNMTDIQAAMGIVELERYNGDMLERRKKIFGIYSNMLSGKDWAVLPPFRDENAESSYHVYLLRIRDLDEKSRDWIIDQLAVKGISVNVHYIPLPLMTYYKNAGYDIRDYPVSMRVFKEEISLPVYYDLSDEDAVAVASELITALGEVSRA